MSGIDLLMLVLILPAIVWLWRLALVVRMMTRDATNEGRAGLIN